MAEQMGNPLTGPLPSVVIDRVADLVAVSVADGDEVRTLGYHTPGDGGHRRVYYSASSTAAVDNVLVFSAGGVGRFLAADIEGPIRAKQGGCRGDDVTDDWSTLAAVIATGRSVDIVDGTFRISDKLTIATDGQRIFSSGRGALRQTSDNKNLIEVTADNVTIENLTALGFGTSPTPSTSVNNNFVYSDGTTNLQVVQCRAVNFAFAGVQLRNCTGFQVQRNFFWGNITNSHDSAMDVMTWGNCRAGVIAGNVCASDLDVGIGVGSLMGDSDITIQGNVICTLDAVGNLVNPTQRRRSIAVHYATDADELNQVSVTGNICVGSQNAGIYFNGWGGAITIVGNVVRNTSLGNVDETLSGGISIQGSARSITIGFNDLSGQQSTSVGCINLTRAHSGATPNLGSCLIVGNQCHDSDSFGISILGSTEKLVVAANEVWNTTRHGIYVASTALLDASDLRISNNLVQLSSSTACGIWLDTQGGSNRVFVHDNSLLFTGTRGTLADNAAIYTQRHNLTAYRNHVKGFKSGMYFFNVITGRVLQPDISANVFEDLDVGVVGRGTSGHTVMFIEPDNEFDNVALRSDGDGFYDAVRVGRVNRATNLVEIYGTALPVLGTFVVGDALVFTAPVLGSWSGARCVAAGTPGTWALYGYLGDELTKSITIPNPTAAENLTLFRAGANYRVTRLSAVLVGSSSPSVTWSLRFGADRSAAGTEVVTGGTTTTSTTTGSSITSLNSTDINTDDWLRLTTTAVSGTVTQLHVTVNLERR